MIATSPEAGTLVSLCRSGMDSAWPSAASSRSSACINATDGTDLFLAGWEDIARVPTTGGPLQTMLSGGARGYAITLDSERVYWTTDDGTASATGTVRVMDTCCGT